MTRKTAIERDIAECIEEARINALARLSRAARAVLPEGWRLIIAVGWGIRLEDGTGKVQAEFGLGDEIAPRLPKGVRGLFMATLDFADAFGTGNEVLTRAGLRYVRDEKTVQPVANSS